MSNNYSYETSYPAYKESPLEKKRQADELMLFIKRGANNLLQLSQLSGLPQSTVSGRCNDLKSEGKIDYAGYVIYNDRKRKKIVVIKPVVNGTQTELF